MFHEGMGMGIAGFDWPASLIIPTEFPSCIITSDFQQDYNSQEYH